MNLKTHIKNIILEINSDNNLISDEVIENTPERIETFYKEIFSGLYLNPYDFLKRTFPIQNNDLVIEKNISFYSMCEHHFIPFYGKAHIAYIPNGKVTGLSKLARTVEVFAKRPQLQERLTAQIAEAIMENLDTKGVLVIIEAEHMCMTMRGIKKPGTKTTTIVGRGILRDNIDMQNQIISLIKF